MKKSILSILAAMFLVGFTACGKVQESTETVEEPATEEVQMEEVAPAEEEVVSDSTEVTEGTPEN